MKILIDMNLSPAWIPILEDQGWEALHWSHVGNPSASDSKILSWAQQNGYVIFTHDLDFGAILAASRSVYPSVLQLRTQDVSPSHATQIIIRVLQDFQSQLEEGALLSIDEGNARVRMLPLT